MIAIAALRRHAPRRASLALLPSFAFAGTVQPVIWNGLEPVFVDVDQGHWHLSPHALEQALNDRRGQVAIVIALSSFGTPPAPDVRNRWQDLCRQARVPLLVDSAAGFGAQAADGAAIGSQGDAEVVSFHAVKPLAVGEGGAVFSRSSELVNEIVALAEFGFGEGRSVLHLHGLNAKMSEPCAAIGLAALDEFAEALATRRAIADRMLLELPEGFRVQDEHQRGTWQFVPVAAPDAATRDAVLETARASVELRTYYEPLHRMPGFTSAIRADDLAVTEELSRRLLSLPMATDLDVTEIEAIVQTLHAGAHSARQQRRGLKCG
jgi:dTDP-4-amino-4,6-dideoxygalactose transaminase